MNNVLVSNLKSPIVLKNTEPSAVELVSYAHRKNTGISSMFQRKFKNQASAPVAVSELNGQQHDMLVNKDGRLQMIVIRTPFTIGATMTTFTSLSGQSGLGKRILNASLSTGSNVVHSQSAYSFDALFDCLSVEQKSWVNKITQVFNAATGMPTTGALVAGTPYFTYTPVLGSFMHGDRMTWDMQILEDTRLYINYGIHNFELGFGSVPTSLYLSANSKPEAFGFYIDYEKQYKDDLFLSNFGSEGGYKSYLSYNTESKKFSVTSNTTTSIQQTFKSPARNINLALVRIKPESGLEAVCARNANGKIYTLTMSLNGQTFIENIDTNVLPMFMESHGGANYEMMRDCTSRLAVDETSLAMSFCSRPTDLTSFSGSLAFATINDADITITYGTLSDVANWAILYRHVYYCELLMDGKSGSFVMTVSA